MKLKGENEMKLSEMKNIKKADTLPLGTHEVTFKEIQYRINADEDVIGAFIHIEGFESLYIPIFNDDRNFQLKFLIKQLGAETADEADINACKGKVIKATRYPRGEYINVSFNPRAGELEEVEEFA
jgi:hypothetical protein